MFQPVIKWSGSKRSQASKLLSYFPKEIKCYYEPFVGGGAMLYAASPAAAVCGDICEPLISLWNRVKMSPDTLAEEYRVRWERLQCEGYLVYYEIRDSFNTSHAPEDLLFLRTRISSAIRKARKPARWKSSKKRQ